MNNKYINSFIFLLLIISLAVINFNQEDELNDIEVGNETLEDVIKSTSSTSTSSTSTSSTSTSSTSTSSTSTSSTSTSSTSTSSTSTSSTSTSSTSTSSTSTSSTSSTTIFAGPYSEYAGFEGSNQAALDELSTQLPKLMLQIIETNNIKIINGCHQYGASLNNRCPYGVWDSSGTSPDGTKDADWSLSIWISNRAFSAGVAYDVLLHESLHAFSYSQKLSKKFHY